MLPATIREPPRTADFTPLADHQEATPAVFFNGKPVLHLEVRGATAAVARSQCDGTLVMFPSDAGRAGEDEAEGQTLSEEKVDKTVDVVVSSENLILFSTEHEAGVAIPYPAIAIHAIQTLERDGQKVPVVWMQLELWDSSSGDSEFGDPIELTLALPDTATTATATSTTTDTDSAEPSLRDRIQALYSAITTCAELHPDPADSDSDADDFDRIIFEGGGRRVDGLPGAWDLGENGMPPSMPGSGGWITADNVHEFFDEGGNWIGGEEEEGVDGEEGEENAGEETKGGGQEESDEQTAVGGELGEGAGRVRDRSEVEREELKAAEVEPVVVSEEKKEEEGVEAKKQRIE